MDILSQENIKLIAFHLLKKWYFLVLAAIIGAGIGFLRLRNRPPMYSATISFVLSTESRPNMGISGLASQLGFDGAGGADNIFSGDNIILLFKSRSLIGRALLFEADSAKHLTLLNLIASKQFEKQYKAIGPFGKDPRKFSPAQTRLYRMIISRAGASFNVFKRDKNHIIYLLTATSTDPDIAYYTSMLVLDETSRYFIETKTKVSATSVSLLQHEADSLATVLSHIYSSTASMNDQTYNLNPAISVQRSSMIFNQARANANAAAYTEVMRNLEVAKINLQKETPLYRIIDSPELPLPVIIERPLKPIIKLSAMAFLLMAGFLVARLLWKNRSDAKRVA